MKILIGLSVLAGLFLLPLSASAFECPRHFATAQAAIDKVSSKMKGMSGKDMALVHALLDDAKTWLSSGKHNHEKPQGKYDHARAIAKADAALGSAKAAGLLMDRM